MNLDDLIPSLIYANYAHNRATMSAADLARIFANGADMEARYQAEVMLRKIYSASDTDAMSAEQRDAVADAQPGAWK